MIRERERMPPAEPSPGVPPTDLTTSRVPLRRRLVVLTAAAVVPLAVIAGIGLYSIARQQDLQTERVGRELARSMANAIDSELHSLSDVVDALATTSNLDQNDLDQFRVQADRLLRMRPDWAAIELADRDLKILVDTRLPPATPPPPLQDRDSFDRVLQRRTPIVGNLTREQGEWLFTVQVPIVQHDAVAYIVTTHVKPQAIRDAVARQQAPGDWVISIVDSAGLRIARSKAHEENLGGRLSETAQSVVARGGADGFGLSYSLEGERIYTPYSRVGTSGWLAVLGMPTGPIDAARYRSLAIYGGGVLLSILLGTLGALAVARSITRPIADLGVAAEAVTHRTSPIAVNSSIREIGAVGAALEAARQDLLKSEADREALLGAERRAREVAETADRAKEEFLAVLSHELRTPINAVLGWARMLQTGQLRDDNAGVRAKAAIVRNADILVQLIDDLLDLSRITSGKMRLEIGSVDLPAILLSAIDSVRPAADAKGIQIETIFDPDVATVTGDPARLQQVAWNLLMNAVKFTPRSGQVYLLLQRDASHVQIVVKDTGQGITRDLLPHVFERFRQADTSSTRAHSGLGLGLALVKHLVELQGGTVLAESDGAGRGATLTVTLPVEATIEPTAAPQRPAAAPTDVRLSATNGNGGVVRLDGIHVLLTDDDRDSIAYAETILTDAGAEVRTCDSAAAALQLLTHWRPDVLVSDIEMPNEDGYSLIRKVRALGVHEGGETPAVALTANGRPEDRLRCLTAGFNMHVPKPVDPGELTAIISGVVGLIARST